MKTIQIKGQSVAVHCFDTLVIGTGCAGYNAADTLYDLGRRDLAILTEGVNMGTSRNTGSDKQTYYKLSMASDHTDSIYDLAQTLFAGGSVNGDTALCEAAGSIRSFMKLVGLGVPFPTNQYGEFVGYKTDHDPRQRASSCGPLTSKIMTEKLQQAVESKNIPVFDGMQVVRLITHENRIRGVIAQDLNRLSGEDYGLCLFLAGQVVLATGGPAIVYAQSVYPESQTGMSGMALAAGAAAANLQEWQYGLASTKFRWNVSGTYQQVLPRYIAVDAQGNEREFLTEYFSDPAQALDLVFLKGYQWPFDTKKMQGSSLIDLIVYHEVCGKGNRVFMDFTREPSGLETGFDRINETTRHYLERSDALCALPIERLAIMNPKAIQIYADHGIDLYNEPLEVMVCAQHHNGGIAVDMNWESSVQGLYVAGEAAGTFGVARPGGSALNSTQAGSLRAAQHIAYHTKASQHTVEDPETQALTETVTQLETLLANPEKTAPVAVRRHYQELMTRYAAHIRNPEKMTELAGTFLADYREFFATHGAKNPMETAYAFKNRDMLLTQAAVLSAMSVTAAECCSRGSGLVLGEGGEKPVFDGLSTQELDGYRMLPGNDTHLTEWLKTVWDGEVFRSEFVPVRPLPRTDDWFETVWNEYNRMIGL